MLTAMNAKGAVESELTFRRSDMDYKRLATVIRRFANIELLASEIESVDIQGAETIDELSEYLEDELDYLI